MNRCELCASDAAKWRTFGVTWQGGDKSPPGAWSAILCDACIEKFVELMAEKKIIVQW